MAWRTIPAVREAEEHLYGHFDVSRRPGEQPSNNAQSVVRRLRRPEDSLPHGGSEGSLCLCLCRDGCIRAGWCAHILARYLWRAGCNSCLYRERTLPKSVRVLGVVWGRGYRQVGVCARRACNPCVALIIIWPAAASWERRRAQGALAALFPPAGFLSSRAPQEKTVLWAFREKSADAAAAPTPSSRNLSTPGGDSAQTAPAGLPETARHARAQT